MVVTEYGKEGIGEQLWSDRLLLALLLVVGCAIRWQLIYRMHYSIDSDEAIVGLMANHILEGRGIPVFYYGQHYMGSLEPILVAFAFSLFGSSSLVLRAVPLVLSLTLIPLLYLLGREAGGRRAGRIAAILCALPPAALVEWSSKPRGGFIEIVCISACCLWLALRWTRQGVPRLWQSFSIGLLLGFGWWVNNQIVFTVGTIGVVWAAIIVGRVWPVAAQLQFASLHGLSGLAGFVIGGIPFWIYNLTNNFVSFSLFGRAERPLENAIGFIRDGVPIIVGAKRFWSTAEVWSGDCLFAAILYGWAVMRLLAHAKRPGRHPLATALPLIFIGLTGTIFSFSAFGWLFMAPRYLLPLYPALFLLVALSFSSTPLVESVLACALFIILHLSSVMVGGWPLPGEPVVYGEDRVARDHTQLIEWLKERDIRWVRTNYWIGYRLAFETGERVRFLTLGEPRETRIDEYEEIGERLDPQEVAYVLTPRQAPILERSMRALSITYERVEVGSYVVMWRVINPFRQLTPIARSKLRVRASTNDAAANQAIDGSTHTRWGSGRPQSPEMFFRISTDDGMSIRGIRIVQGEWWPDYPRKLRIECETSSGEREDLLSAEDYFKAVSYVVGRGALELPFPKERRCNTVTLYQLGSDSLFDWSIAEVELFGSGK